MDTFNGTMRPGPGHAIRLSGPVNNLHEAPAIGNGDVGALVQVFQNEFRLHLGKSDVFDARFDYDTAKSVYPQEKLVRASRDYGFRMEGGAYDSAPKWDRQPPPELEYPDDIQGWNKHVFPCPKPAGFVAVRHSGISSTAIETVVDLASGTVRTSFAFDYDWHGKGTLIVEAFVDAGSNAIRLRLRTEGLVGSVRLVAGKMPDPLDTTLPPPAVRREGDWRGTVTQVIPAGYGAPEFAWHLAASFPRPGPGCTAGPVEAQAYQLCQTASVKPGHTLEWSVGLATDREARGAGGSRELALERAGGDPAAGHDGALAAHTAWWDRFWAASGIALEDAELERTWYRNLFALACHIRHGALAPGLCANVVPYEKSPWHGVYTVNMNIQKMFLASLPANHPEWIECYADWLDHMMPSFEHLAQLTFGLAGIHAVHMLLPWVSPGRQASSNQCGRALGMTGWLGQPLWWHWEHTRDRGFLERRAYPYFRKAADFYVRYFEKFMDESGDIFPSLNLEAPPWTRGFAHNRDCFIDLILFRKTFEWALAAAAELGVDADRQAEWRSALARVRPLGAERLADGHGWIRADRNDDPPADSAWWDDRANRGAAAVTAAWSIFPGEYADGDEEDGPAAIAREIMRHTRWEELHPAVVWIHHWWCALPALRMGLENAFAVARKIILQERFPAGHARTTQWINLQPDAWRAPEDNYLGVVATTEMLLQSQGGLIRLFPAWPAGQRASFRDLPARGGFVVSASWSPAEGLDTEILSRAGEECRIRWTRPDLPEVTSAGAPVPACRDGRTVRFATRAGETYRLRTR